MGRKNAFFWFEEEMRDLDKRNFKEKLMKITRIFKKFEEIRRNKKIKEIFEKI